MKSLISAFLAVACLIFALAPVSSWAKDKKNDKSKKPKTYVKVDSVNAGEQKISITDREGETQEYTVDNLTVILISGKPGKLADISKGMKADITVGANRAKLSRLEVSEAPQDKPEKNNKH